MSASDLDTKWTESALTYSTSDALRTVGTAAATKAFGKTKKSVKGTQMTSENFGSVLNASVGEFVNRARQQIEAFASTAADTRSEATTNTDTAPDHRHEISIESRLIKTDVKNAFGEKKVDTTQSTVTVTAKLKLKHHAKKTKLSETFTFASLGGVNKAEEWASGSAPTVDTSGGTVYFSTSGGY